ncbi:MAG: putative T7SS-secreted protein, partial [Sporichthyaceae bacterium]
MTAAPVLPGPLPGHPGELFGPAQELTGVGISLTEVGAGLRRLSTDGWYGQAAERFRGAFEGEPARWERAGQAFTDTARALAAYADALGYGQERAEAAIAAMTRAQARSAAARAEHDAALAQLERDRVAA